MSANPSRIRTMLIPREHGAWGMLLVPLAAGAVVASKAGMNASALTLFVVATLSLFWLRTPFEAWLGTSAIKANTAEERRSVVRGMVLISSIALAALGVLFAIGYARGLLIIGAVSGVAFGAQALVKRMGRSGRMPAQMIGTIGLTSTAAGAYYVACGKLDATAIALWAANWLFAADQIHYVQVRIRGSKLGSFSQKVKRGRGFLIGQVVLLGALAMAGSFGLVSWIVLAAFVPALLRGMLWFVRGVQPLDVHKLGFSELAQAMLFGALLSAAFLM
jgi:hypothetical protein